MRDINGYDAFSKIQQISKGMSSDKYNVLKPLPNHKEIVPY
jgi:hypothetical protein